MTNPTMRLTEWLLLVVLSLFATGGETHRDPSIVC
jgi:hypothetical protein